MKPCFVIAGNKEFYNFYKEDIEELVNWAQSHKIRVCMREKDGHAETGFFTWNPIKQFKLAFKYCEFDMAQEVSKSLHLTPTLSDSQIDKACADAKL